MRAAAAGLRLGQVEVGLHLGSRGGGAQRSDWSDGPAIPGGRGESLSTSSRSSYGAVTFFFCFPFSLSLSLSLFFFPRSQSQQDETAPDEPRLRLAKGGGAVMAAAGKGAVSPKGGGGKPALDTSGGRRIHVSCYDTLKHPRS